MALYAALRLPARVRRKLSSRWRPCCPFNPPAIAPIFLSLTEGASSSTRTVLSKRVAVNVGLMLVVAMVAGNVLLSFFGISLSIVRVGGGMLVIASAWRLVNSPDADTERVARLAESFTRKWPRPAPSTR